MKILAMNQEELERKKVLPRLMIKYDKNHIPTAYERFVQIINVLHPYFKILKSVLTILSPGKLLH